MGFNRAFSWWYVKGPLAALGVLSISAGAAWWVFGETNSNWFVMHAYTLSDTITNMPENTPIITLFLIVTIPAMIFSPLGEEFLFRGYMQTGLSGRLGKPAAMTIQAAAFAFVHLAHYGLQPFQPDLLLIWLPSMFLAALTFGWIVMKSKSVWCAVISHSIYNLGMNAIVFIVLSDKIS